MRFIGELLFASVTNGVAFLIFAVSLGHDLLVGLFAGARQLGCKDVIMSWLDVRVFEPRGRIRLILRRIRPTSQDRLIESMVAIVLA